MAPHRRVNRPSRLVAGATAFALALTGLVVGSVATAPVANAAPPATLNPFSLSGGFTVYAREDALLQNQETEGSIAVGDTATVQGSSGTYSIIHVSAGTADYTLPTVDGDPARFLVGEYATASTGILAITSAGTSDPSLQGDLKLVDRTGPFQPFARADWTRLNTNPSNVDQTPLIDATHQQYPASAAPPAGSVGGGSIYTANTGSTAVADYVEANADASWADTDACLADLPTTGAPVTINTSASAPPDRVVLNPLSADQVNVLDYDDLPTGTRLLQFSPGPTPGAANPLVIRVAAGTTAVNGLTIDPQGQYSPYLLWDLSEVTGPVTVTAPNGGGTRMDGSIYAPNADLTVVAAPLDGQILGQNVTVRGGEVHSFVFAGEIACDPPADPGTFQMRKALQGITAGDLPAGTVFTVDYEATLPDGTIDQGSLDLPADGTTVPAGVEFPPGTVITFSEVDPPTVPGWEWGAVGFAPSSITIASPPAATPTVTVTNTATRQFGTVSVQKAVVDGEGNTVPGANGSITASWTSSDGQGDDVTFGVDGAPVTLTDSTGQAARFPVGTTVTFASEVVTDATPPPGYEWVDAGWSPSDTVIVDGTTTAVTLTNTVAPTGAQRLFGVEKTVAGDAESAFDYSITYSTDVDTIPVTRDLRVGVPILLQVDPDATALTIAENLPTDATTGEPVDAAGWASPIITIGGTAQTVAFGEPVTLDPLPTGGLIGIQIDNALLRGTFTLQKAFASGFQLVGQRATFGFMVDWTAIEPGGGQTTGTLRIPANGAPVSPTDADGDPLTFPYGTVITYDEVSQPSVPGLDWGAPSYSPESLTIGDGDSATVAATVTNTATWRTGTFLVQKELVGIDPDELLVDEFTISYEGVVPAQGPVSGTFTVPADGTPAGPVDGNGDPQGFPVGSIIHLNEVEPTDPALPPGYEWAGTTWSPRSFVITAETAGSVITVTNSVEEQTRYSVVKTVTGGAASAVPPDTTVPVDWWLDYAAQPRLQLQPNVVLVSDYFPVGSIVEAREATPPSVPGVVWGTPTYYADGVALTPEPDGKVVLPAASVDTQGTVEIVLENQAITAPTPTPTPGPLPNTGGTWSPAVTYAGLAALLVGAALVLRRRRVTKS